MRLLLICLMLPHLLLAGISQANIGATNHGFVFIQGKYISPPYTFSSEDQWLIVNGKKAMRVRSVWEAPLPLPEDEPEFPKSLQSESPSEEDLTEYMRELSRYLFSTIKDKKEALGIYKERISRCSLIETVEIVGDKLEIKFSDMNTPLTVRPTRPSPAPIRTWEDVLNDHTRNTNDFIRHLSEEGILFFEWSDGEGRVYSRVTRIPRQELRTRGVMIVKTLKSTLDAISKARALISHGFYPAGKEVDKMTEEELEAALKYLSPVIENYSAPPEFYERFVRTLKAPIPRPKQEQIKREPSASVKENMKIAARLDKEVQSKRDVGKLRLFSMVRDNDILPLQPTRLFVAIVNKSEQQTIRFRHDPWKNNMRVQVTRMNGNRQLESWDYVLTDNPVLSPEFEPTPPSCYTALAVDIFGTSQPVRAAFPKPGKYRVQLAYQIDTGKWIHFPAKEINVREPSTPNDKQVYQMLSADKGLLSNYWTGYQVFLATYPKAPNADRYGKKLLKIIRMNPPTAYAIQAKWILSRVAEEDRKAHGVVLDQGFVKKNDTELNGRGWLPNLLDELKRESE